MKLTVASVLVVVHCNLCDGFGTLSSVRKPAMIGSSFTPKSVALPALAESPTRNNLRMLVQMSGGMLELEEMLESDTGVTKTIRKSPMLWKLASYAAIPASAAIGFGIVPSTRLAAHAVGAVATGVAGLIGRNKMTDISSVAAKPAIAQCLIEVGISEPIKTQERLKALQKEYSVHPDDFVALCADVYRKYLVGMVKFDPKPRSSELRELENLKTALMLDNIAVGEAHMLAAEDWFREVCLLIEEDVLEDEDSLERMAMNKFLYLTERALRQNGENDGAFLYEMTRTAKVFNITYPEALERVDEVVEPFYEQALKSARAKLGTSQVSSTMLERARRDLGVNDRMGFDLHESALNDEVRSLLYGNIEDGQESSVDPKTVKFPEGTLERLEQLREMLSLNQEDVEYEITSEAMPLFRATALDAMADAVAGSIAPEEAWKIMDQRREELLIPAEKSHELVSTVVVNALGPPMEEVKKYLDVNNEAAVYDEVFILLESVRIVQRVLRQAGWGEDFYDSFCNPMRRQSVISMITNSERLNLYDVFLRRAVMNSEDGKLNDEQDAVLEEIRKFFYIDDVAAEGQATKNFGPKLYAVMERAMNEILEDSTDTLVETLGGEIRQVIDDFKISDRMIAQNGRNLYMQAVAKVNARAPGGIPTKEQNEALAALQKLYKLDSKEVTPLHLNTFGPLYKKSVEEAMSITGIIRSEYRKPLEDLRERIGVTEQQARTLFLDAVKERMVPMVKWIVGEMEKTVFNQQQLAQRRGKDMGEDYFQSGKQAEGTLGLGSEVNVLGDIMNLVDFYTENEVAEKLPVDTKTVEGGSQKKTVKDEHPVYKTIYPITALGVGAVDEQMAELLYRQFVVGSFTTQGPNAARYENSRATFGGILGLSSEKMEEIGSNIADTVYDNYISQAMRTKGALDQQDMMFLANLQTKLGLSSEQGEKMMTAVQKKILVEELDDIMSSPSPLSVKAFREKCNSMGLGLEEDLGVSKGRLTRMFEVEVAPALESGEITIDSGDLLTEIQESLGFAPEEAEKALETIILQKADRDFEKIAKDVRRGRMSDIVEPVKRLVRYGAFLDGDLGIEIEEKVGRQIYNAYENFDFSSLSSQEVEDNKEMLKTILCLS